MIDFYLFQFLFNWKENFHIKKKYSNICCLYDNLICSWNFWQKKYGYSEWQQTSLFISPSCVDGCFTLEHRESTQSSALNMPSAWCYAKTSSFHHQQVANLLKYLESTITIIPKWEKQEELTNLWLITHWLLLKVGILLAMKKQSLNMLDDFGEIKPGFANADCKLQPAS